MKKEYEPFGEEWKKEAMKLPKKLIVKMFSDKGQECEIIREELYRLKTLTK